MSRFDVADYFAPWKSRRQQEELRVAALRERDGENCRRCRRPIRFDLARGHDRGPRIEPIGTAAPSDPHQLEDLCLCHARCHAAGADHTHEVVERIRRKGEADLLSSKRRARKRA